MEGFGVGNENASATQAVLLTTIQEATSRLASMHSPYSLQPNLLTSALLCLILAISFAWHLGSALEPEAKMYRLAADVFNDSAIILDCLSPALDTNLRVVTLCLSGCLKALCGVAAGGSKAALSVHFTKTGNVGELNAKDSSQETVLGLIGMLVGSSTCACYIILTII